MTSELGKLIDEHRAAQKYPPSYTRIAEAAGVSKQVMVKWRAGTAGLPYAENLRGLARALSVPYQRVLDAALVDAGYYEPTRPEERGRDAAPMNVPDLTDMSDEVETLTSREAAPRTRRGRGARGSGDGTPRAGSS